LKAVSV